MIIVILTEIEYDDDDKSHAEFKVVNYWLILIASVQKPNRKTKFIYMIQ